MTGYIECYRILGVNIDAGMGDVAASYKKLCRQHHPDINNDPSSEELMKNINMAYTVLRDKFKREAALQQRMAHHRHGKRHNSPNSRGVPPTPESRADTIAAVESFSSLFNYFRAICDCDYAGAYKYLSDYDKQTISLDDFTNWRKSVARMFPMLEFKLAPKSEAAKIVLPSGKPMQGRKYIVTITEDDIAANEEKIGEVEKFAICERGFWKVFLGYEDVGEITKSFDKRFEQKKRRGAAKTLEEYFAGHNADFDILNLVGFRKAVDRELYRHERYGDELTFAVVSVRTDRRGVNAGEQLIRSAARTICSCLRQIDVPAYAGDGVFAVLFSRLTEEDAEAIISRIPDKIRQNAGPAIGPKAQIAFAHKSWHGEAQATVEEINEIFRAFGKEV